MTYNLKEDATNSKSKDEELVSNLPKEVTNKNMDKEIIEIFRVGDKMKIPQNQVKVKFDSQSTKNMVVLDKSSRLKDSEILSKVILSLEALSKEDRED